MSFRRYASNASLLLGATLLLAACPEDSSLEHGLWTYTKYEVVDNTCDVPTLITAPVDFVIAYEGDSTLLVPVDGKSVLRCEIDASLECEQDDLFVVEGFSSNVFLHIEVEASVSDSGTRRTDGTRKVTVEECDGECAEIGNFPCSFTIEFAAEWVENGGADEGGGSRQ